MPYFILVIIFLPFMIGYALGRNHDPKFQFVGT
jgi:hypothetical protein